MNPVTFLTDEDIYNPDVHARYFTITDDGVVSLKPEYRGANDRADCPDAISDNGSGVAGSMNAYLPKHLIIPEIVDGVAVSSLAKGIFRKNLAVVNVTLPNYITVLPDRCFDGCNKLKNLYGTENIKTIGHCAFQSTSCVRLKFPNLEQFASTSGGSCTSIFQKCGRLVYIDIGNVTALPDKTFNECAKLNAVRSKNSLSSVGANGFSLTATLKQANVSGLTNIGKAAFLCSGMDYDWGSLQNCTFGVDATVKQSNPTDFWSACNFTPCENPLPTFLSQNDARWTNRQIGTSGVKYSAGCLWFCYMHSYCGLHNLALSSVEEFENIAGADLMGIFDTSINAEEPILTGLGLSVESNGTFNQSTLQRLYDALAAGGYAIIDLRGKSTSLGHAVIAYGINEKGELLLADSIARGKDDESEPTKYSLPFQKITAQNGSIGLQIVSL